MKLRVAAVALALFACTPAPVDHTVVVGDSIIFGARGQGAFDWPSAFFDVQPGRDLSRPGILIGPDGSWHAGTSGVEALPWAELHRSPGGWTVIELGSNRLDLAASGDEDEISRLMAMVPGCLAWVNVWDEHRPLRSKQFNVALVLADLKRGESCTRIVDWATEARFEPSYLSDGLHTTPAGSSRLAQLVREATN